MSNPNPQLPTCPTCKGRGEVWFDMEFAGAYVPCPNTEFHKAAETIPTPDLLNIGEKIDTKAAETYTNPAKPIHETAKSIQPTPEDWGIWCFEAACNCPCDDCKAGKHCYLGNSKPHEIVDVRTTTAELDKHIDNLMADYGDALKELTDDGIDQLVRDACSVVPVSKSEYRKRLEAWSRMESQRAVEAELRRIRKVYDDMELAHETDSMEADREYVTWRGWKMIRNVITDRIEELTGGRQ